MSLQALSETEKLITTQQNDGNLSWYQSDSERRK